MKTAVLVKDEDGCCVFANPAAYSLLGFEPGALLGKCMTDLCPSDPGLIARAFEQLKQDGAWAGRYLMRHASGRLIEVAACEFLHTDRDGSRLYVDFVYPLAADIAVARTRPNVAALARESGLTTRDVCLLQLMVESLSDDDVSVLFGAAVPALQTQIGDIIREMHASSRTEACVQAIKRGLVR